MLRELPASETSFYILLRNGIRIGLAVCNTNSAIAKCIFKVGCPKARGRHYASDLPQRSSALALQLGQGFLIHIPALQNGEDSPGSEPSPSQLPEDARRFLLIFGFH